MYVELLTRSPLTPSSFSNRGTAVAVAASAAVVILSTVLFPQMAVDGAAIAVDDDKLFEVSSIFPPKGVYSSYAHSRNHINHDHHLSH